MNVFYHAQSDGDLIVLDEGESHHAVKVLRLTEGNLIVIMDGKGSICTAEIQDPHPKRCECKVVKKSFSLPRSFHLHVAIAPTKLNDRMEWFLEKATEIGVEEITPVICARSERRQVNHERFQKVLIAAMKQSMNPWLPVLNEQEDFSKFITRSEPGFMAHCIDSAKIPLKQADLNTQRVTILVGPEGDFTPSEVEQAVLKKWEPVSLGNTRLRTETAGIVACHTIALLKT